MLKLSDIKKMILMTGLVLAFSCGMMIDNAFADAACEQRCETEYKDNKSQRKACKSQCKADDKAQKAKGAQSAYYNAVGREKEVHTHTLNETKVTITMPSTGWTAARDKRDTKQSEYTTASKNYNICVATKGAASCINEKRSMETARSDLDKATSDYNKAQKEASKAANEATKANNKAAAAQAKAEKKQLKADKKDLKNAEKALKKCLKNNNNDSTMCVDEMDAVAKAEEKVDSHNKASNIAQGDGNTQELNDLAGSYSNPKDAKGNPINCAESPKKCEAAKSDALNSLKAYKDKKEQEAKKAEAECERYSAMTSKDAQAKAKEACAKAVALRKEADAASTKFDELKTQGGSLSGTFAAEGRLKSLTEADMSAGEGKKGVVDISASRKISATGSGNDSLKGYKSGLFNYGSSDDVLETVTRRAALAVVSLKPIVYIFAGFGLIAFAWMAIFNKISWKWFANIAMGLFLVANMGRLIEYFVAGGDNHYYVGTWTSAKTGASSNQLANATKDSYYVYGDTQYNQKGIRDFSQPPAGVDTEIVKEAFSADAAGFCKGTSASGWANFTSCMSDIVSTAKKVTSTVMAAKAAVDDVVDRVETIADTAKNIGQAAKAMASGDVLGGLSSMVNNINTMASTATGAVGSLTNVASTISNNVQDMGKSVAQQQELADRRASGEATNKFDAMLKGQEWNSATGGVENVDGQWAGKSNAWTDVQNAAKDIKDKSASVAGSAGQILTSTQAAVNGIESTLGVFGVKSRAEAAREKSDKKAAANAVAQQKAAQEAYQSSNAGKNAAYREQNNQTNQLYSNMQNQQNEVKQLENQKKSAEAAVKQNCADESSALCQASKAQLSATEAALADKQSQLTATQEQYNKSKEELESKYQAALESNINEAQSDYDNASKQADEICKANASSQECATARRKTMEAANKLSSYVSEKEKQTGNNRYQTKEDVVEQLANNQETQELKKQEEKLKYEEEQEALRLKNEAANAKQQYEKSMDEANTLYTQMNAQEKEVKELEQQAKEKASAAVKACSGNPNSAVCTTAQTAASVAKAASENKKSQLNQTKNEYNAAKNKAETAYKNSVNAGISQAQRDYENAKKQAEDSKKAVDDANAKMADSAAAAKTAETAYNTAKTEAQNARSAYEKAQSGNASQDEIDRLKAEYEAKLKAMNDANNDYQKKNAAYNDLQKQKQEAQKAYNEAYSKANDASERLASYTNENVNKTGESRLNSSEDLDNQALINQYKSDTNPNAIAQASKNSYIEHKNKTDVARNNLQEKQSVAANAKALYEAAREKADKSGSEEDKRAADRLRNNYELAVNEVAAAEKEYNSLNGELGNYQSDYVAKAIDSEKYKQSVYTSQMKQASSDINKYEQLVASQRKIVDSAASKYTQAKNNANGNNTEALTKAAKLYDEYKKAKEVYEEYLSSLSQAKNNYSNAQKKYQESVAEQARLEKMS